MTDAAKTNSPAESNGPDGPGDRAGPAVALAGVLVTRQRRAVLRVPDLAVTRGEFLGVIGPNGSGKSTLLAVIAGRLRPAKGRLD